jgi:hypothetical protein
MNSQNHNVFNLKLFPTVLQLKRSSINREIYVYKDFLLDINNLAISEKRKLEEMVNELVLKDPDNSEEIYDHFSDQFHIYDSKYVELANNGLLVNAYSFFEYQLKEIYRMLDRFLVNKKTLIEKSNNNGYAARTKNNIYDITGLDFSSLENLWLNLDQYRKIRNVIVHNGANLYENKNKQLVKQKNYDLVSSFNEITINQKNGDFYITDHKLIFDYLDKVDEYLTEVCNILKKLKNKDIC